LTLRLVVTPHLKCLVALEFTYIFLIISPKALLSGSSACFTARYQAAADGSVPREAISEDLKLSDADTFYGMKDTLCLNSMNHDASRRSAQPLCWSCRVPLSDRAAAEEALYALKIKEEDDLLFGTDASRVERSARASMERGVCVRWLVHFTNAHKCWSWPTWRVVENIIKVTQLSIHFILRSFNPHPCDLCSHLQLTLAVASSICLRLHPPQMLVEPISSCHTHGVAYGETSSPPPLVLQTRLTVRCAFGATYLP
jgi:hypothetical protein